MCGIIVCVQSETCKVSHDVLGTSDWKRLVQNNAARGPDLQNMEDLVIPTEENLDIYISFLASTLHLRGSRPFPQPHTSAKSIFCWNGEVFEGIDISTDSNDGAVLFSTLDNLENPEDIYSFMSKIEGPYAFVLYQRRTRRLFFARDPLGRRSLLIHRPTEAHPYFILSSTSAGTNQSYCFEEVNTQYIYCLDVRCMYTAGKIVTPFERVIHANERPVLDGYPSFVRASDLSLLALVNQWRAMQARLARVNRTIPNEPQNISLSCLTDELSTTVDQFLEALDTSVRLRVQHIPREMPQLSESRARVAVLYSGGIDSTMVAFLANKHVPPDEPIDLLNVAFENPRKVKLHNDGIRSKKKNKIMEKANRQLVDREETAIYDVPDRLSGREELEELRRLCPGRQWNLVEIDVGYSESSQAKSIIEDIMLPSRTVMDLSLALALYFASRGIGRVRNTTSNIYEPYASSARVLLNGLGSDELLGGYGRHRSAFNTGGWQGVIDELQLELDRLPSRNLGRDDRMISCHGKETRHPFLSLTVVDFVARLPVHLKTDGRLEVGLGDKMLLRLAARKVGLEAASRRKKRAMQFGSYSARMETGVSDKDGERMLSSGL